MIAHTPTAVYKTVLISFAALRKGRGSVSQAPHPSQCNRASHLNSCFCSCLCGRSSCQDRQQLHVPQEETVRILCLLLVFCLQPLSHGRGMCCMLDYQSVVSIFLILKLKSYVSLLIFESNFPTTLRPVGLGSCFEQVVPTEPPPSDSFLSFCLLRSLSQFTLL